MTWFSIWIEIDLDLGYDVLPQIEMESWQIDAFVHVAEDHLVTVDGVAQWSSFIDEKKRSGIQIPVGDHWLSQ